MSILIIDTLTLLWSDQLTMSLKFYPVMMLEVCMNIPFGELKCDSVHHNHANQSGISLQPLKMSPNTASTGKDNLIADEEEVLQAVILADSFNKRFKPLTTHKPRVSPFPT
jgi:hypothetical protein